MIKRILVAIDSSEPAAAAVAAAKRLARQVNGEMILIHVLDSASLLRAQGVERFQPSIDDLKHVGSTLLRRMQERISPDIRVSTQLVEGDPPEQIVAAAVAERADIIVIGTDSRGRLAHFLLGSTADTVIRYAPCPVLTVRADRTAKREDDKRIASGVLN